MEDRLAVLPRVLLLAADAYVDGVGGGPGGLGCEHAPGQHQGQAHRGGIESSHHESWAPNYEKSASTTVGPRRRIRQGKLGHDGREVDRQASVSCGAES